jgi:hypothetical protein
MTEQELKPLIVQLYTELLTRLMARTQDDYGEGGIAEGAEMLANQFTQDMKEADELDDLFLLSLTLSTLILKSTRQFELCFQRSGNM